MSNNNAEHYNDLLKLGIDEVMRLAERGEHMRWVSVSEKRPEDGQEVDIWVVDEDGHGRRITGAEFDENSMLYLCDEYDFDALADGEDEHVTHWMPLPEPPVENARPEVES